MTTRKISLRSYFALVLLWVGLTQSAWAQEQARLLEWEGKVEFAPANTETWRPVRTNQIFQAEDQLRTGPASRALILLTDQSTIRLGPKGLIRIPPAERRGPLQLLRGLLYFFHRDEPREIPVRTPNAYAVVLGTEFQVTVDETGTTRLDLINGQVELKNDDGQISLKSGESGVVRPGQHPERTAALAPKAAIQWLLYYPAVLDLDDLGLTKEETEALSDSVEAYRQGDLLSALAAYPDRAPSSDREKVYQAALLLAVGEVEASEKLLESVKPDEHLSRLTGALRTLIAVVRGTRPELPRPGLATQRLAESYARQADYQLAEALRSARRATELSPRFSFAWVRLAELQFAFGKIDSSRRSLEKGLALGPRNPRALALKGFLRAAQNQQEEAIALFDQAIAIDGALADAWLGRGLCKFRRGDSKAGRIDLQAAATLEPQRSILRSYLAKAYSEVNEQERALAEAELARMLDPADPTGWFYSALLLRQENRINESLQDLERSQELNKNRRLYRSTFLIDQDEAVRGVNQALLYEDAGMEEWSRREAGRAVEKDYANYSSHLFLANSYQALRDAKGVNQRFETPAVTEYLLASLLAPVHAGVLAQSVTPQEYSSLFERDGVGVASMTEYLSRGAWLESGAQYGHFGGLGYALGAYYQTDNGQRVNNELERLELSFQLQQELTPDDTFYLRVLGGAAEGGDIRQLYDPNSANADVHFTETQWPFVLAGYHHEWAPGVHTLALAGWLDDEFKLDNPSQETLLFDRDASGVTAVNPLFIEQAYRSELQIQSAEIQQIWQRNEIDITVGGRYQQGEVHVKNRQTDPANFAFPFLFPADQQRITSDFQRMSSYIYGRVRPLEQLQLVAGVSYDRVTVPDNFRYAPVEEGERTDDQISPKGGIIWTPTARTTVRGSYSRALGGMSFDQSIRLEPTQVAGFNQAYRSLIPESVAGANSAADFETWNAAVEQKVGSGTYLALSGEILKSRVNRQFGVFAFDIPTFTVARESTREELDYRERSAIFSINQLLGKSWAVGGRYRISEAELENDLPGVSDAISPAGTQRALLQQVHLFAIYNHRSGFFAQGDSLWFGQNNYGYDGQRPGDDFWQFNASIGYRFLRRRGEVRLGLLNIADQDYRLNPLNLTAELPRDRTLAVSVRLSF